MQIHLERPDYRYIVQRADGQQVLVNGRSLQRSFIIAPDQLIEAWPPQSLAALNTEAIQAILALEPALVVLGTGSCQHFPSAQLMAQCLTRGVGIEVMNNAAAARTFNILAGEGRRVVAGFILPGEATLPAPAPL